MRKNVIENVSHNAVVNLFSLENKLKIYVPGTHI